MYKKYQLFCIVLTVFVLTVLCQNHPETSTISHSSTTVKFYVHNPWRPDLTPPVSLKTVNSSDEILDTAFDIVFRPLFAYKRRQAQKTKNPDYY